MARAEHIPPQDPCANILKTPRGKVIVNAGFATRIAVQHPLKGLGGNRPFVKRSSALAQRMVQVLVRPSAKAVDRNRKTLYAKFGDGALAGVGDEGLRVSGM